MLTFLRKIRKSFIETGSARKPASPSGRYLLYAIGEIALVVIGILLALQINAWNQDKQNRNLEKQYLERIIQDVKQDSVNCFSVIAHANICARLGAKLLDSTVVEYRFKGMNNYQLINENVSFQEDGIYYLNQKLLSPRERPVSLLVTLHEGRSSSLTDVTFNDLMANGKMDVIGNQDLRMEIQEYYSIMEASLGLFEEKYVTPVMINYGELLIELGIGYSTALTFEEVKDVMSRDVRLLPSIEYILNAHSRHINWAQRRYERIIAFSERIKLELSHL